MQKLRHDGAWDEYLNWQIIDKKKLKKINELIKSIERNGYECIIGKPEPLKDNLFGFWSVRIDEKKTDLFLKLKMIHWKFYNVEIIIVISKRTKR